MNAVVEGSGKVEGRLTALGQDVEIIVTRTRKQHGETSIVFA